MSFVIFPNLPILIVVAMANESLKGNHVDKYESITTIMIIIRLYFAKLYSLF